MATNNLNADFLKGNHKIKLTIIIILLIILGFWYFKGINWNNMTTLEGAKQEIKNNSSPDTKEKKVLLGAMTALTVAGGYETYQIWRDSNGNEVASGTPNAKPTEDWDCKDFKTQPEAQSFFEKAGGVTKDTNRLDGNKDGVACQSLPKN
ncbi:MAG: micrococcal nuclease [Patescibacteria group bacterium]|nr:micrococcal nuclease [Patescibacteria group bacterium]